MGPPGRLVHLFESIVVGVARLVLEDGGERAGYPIRLLVTAPGTVAELWRIHERPVWGLLRRLRPLQRVEEPPGLPLSASAVMDGC